MDKAELLDNFVKSIDKYSFVGVDNIVDTKLFIVYLSKPISTSERNSIFKCVQLDSDQVLQIKVTGQFHPCSENQKVMDRARAVWSDAQNNLKIAKINLREAEELHANCESACSQSLDIMKSLINQFGDNVC